VNDPKLTSPFSPRSQDLVSPTTISSETLDEKSSPTLTGKLASSLVSGMSSRLTYPFLRPFRQETAGSAHLTPNEHDRLVATLSALERDPDYYKKVDVYVVKQESLDRRAMLQLLMKTDVSSSLVSISSRTSSLTRFPFDPS